MNVCMPMPDECLGRSMDISELSPVYAMQVGTAIYIGECQPYEGVYEVTPTRYTQILPTAGLGMAQDVIVNPIPPEYGLVTWDGHVLTVS